MPSRLDCIGRKIIQPTPILDSPHPLTSYTVRLSVAFITVTSSKAKAMFAVARAAVRTKFRAEPVRQTRRLASTSQVSPLTPIRRVVSASIALVSGTLFIVYYLDSQSAIHRYVLTPLLRNAVDAETSHKIAVKVLKSGLAPKDMRKDDGVLETEVRSSHLSSFS